MLPSPNPICYHPPAMSDERDERIKKLEAIRALGVDPFGKRFDGAQPAGKTAERFAELENQAVTVAGRITAHRSFGKAAFVRGTRFSTDLGTLQRDRTYSIVIQLRLPWTDAVETEVGSIVLRVPGEGGPRTFERVVSILRNPGPKPGALDPDVHNAVEIVSGIGDVDVEQVLAALLARRELLAAERRSERLLEILDRAVARIRTTGSMEGMSNSEIASRRMTLSSGRMLAAAAVFGMVGCGLPQWPVQGPITAPFGVRWGSGGPTIHRGVDIVVPTGTPVHAMSNGEVRFAGTMTDFGLVVWIDHGDQILTIYAHLSEILVSEGQAITMDDPLGLSGQSGNATHLQPYDPPSARASSRRSF